MAIQTINLGTEPTGVGGDTNRSAMTKINSNFTDATHAASRIVGEAAGNVMQVGAFGLGETSLMSRGSTMADTIDDLLLKPNGMYTVNATNNPNGWSTAKAPHSVFGTVIVAGRNANGASSGATSMLILPYGSGANPNTLSVISRYSSTASIEQIVYTSKNPIIANTANAATSGKLVSVLATGELQSIGFTIDGNGSVKKASPIVRLFADHIELNDDADEQPITFEKKGTGHYLLKGSLGFAQEGWYIEQPKDANGNLYHVVEYQTLDNGDIEIKTYDYLMDKRGRIVADHTTPLDIQDGRWIDIRLHEVQQSTTATTE